MVAGVMLSPTDSFYTIRNNYRRYNLASICVVFAAFTLTVLSVTFFSREDQPDYQILLNVATGFGAGVLNVAVLYCLGRLFGGTKNWLQAFTVYFYTNAVIIGILAAAVIDILFALVFLGWWVIVSIKAVKVVNEFGIWKAIGVWLLGISVVVAVVSMIVVTAYFGECWRYHAIGDLSKCM